MSEFIDNTADRLYNLLPQIHRIRDIEQGNPLKALLNIIGEQVNLLEEDIDRLYENSFIESAEDWAVSYIADLIGYHPLTTFGESGSETAQNGIKRFQSFTPRRDVANTLRHRRRKGTLEILESLAHDVADWPSRAVEFYKLLGWLQNLNHPQLQRAQLADIRNVYQMSLLNSAFDNTARTVDVRRINSKNTVGRYNLSSIGVFVWRLKSYSVTKTQAFKCGDNCFTFNSLGLDTPLFCNPKFKCDYDEEHIYNSINQDELCLPKPLDRRSFESTRVRCTDKEEIKKVNKLKAAYYSLHFKIWEVKQNEINPIPEQVPFENIKITDLKLWKTSDLDDDQIAVDPCTGRIAYPKNKDIKHDILVSYFYGFSADIGGGEYSRSLMEPAIPAISKYVTRFYQVGGCNGKKICEALKKFKDEKPTFAVIEFTESYVFIEPIQIELGPNQYLQMRAANRVRPVIFPVVSTTENKPNAMEVKLSKGSQFVLDGILLAGKGLLLKELKPDPGEKTPSDFSVRVLIRHSTLPPIQTDKDAKAILKIEKLNAKVHIEHSIIGGIQIYQDQVKTDPIEVSISDSLIDSSNHVLNAIGAEEKEKPAHASLRFYRCTIFGAINVHAIEFAENTIFNDDVRVARRQIGCMRFCYVDTTKQSRTPKRYRCQPDLENQDKQNSTIDSVRPVYTALNYNEPGYGQLSLECNEKIRLGADDQSEMGVYHDLYQPQREANLRTRLEEYVPAEFDVNLIFET